MVELIQYDKNNPQKELYYDSKRMIDVRLTMEEIHYSEDKTRFFRLSLAIFYDTCVAYEINNQIVFAKRYEKKTIEEVRADGFAWLNGTKGIPPYELDESEL